MWRSIASRTSRSTSSLVSATATQPGRSGAWAPPNSSLRARRQPCSASQWSSLFQAGLPENGVQGSCWYINARFPSHGNRHRLATVFELPMAPSGSLQSPSVLLQQAYQVSDLQAAPSFPHRPVSMGRSGSAPHFSGSRTKPELGCASAHRRSVHRRNPSRSPLTAPSPHPAGGQLGSVSHRFPTFFFGAFSTTYPVANGETLIHAC